MNFVSNRKIPFKTLPTNRDLSNGFLVKVMSTMLESVKLQWIKYSVITKSTKVIRCCYSSLATLHFERFSLSNDTIPVNRQAKNISLCSRSKGKSDTGLIIYK